MTFASELMSDLRSRFEQTIADLKSYRYDANAPALPLFGAEVAPADASKEALADLLEVLSFYTFDPAIDAAKRGAHLARTLLALEGRAPLFPFVIALQNVEVEREATVVSVVATLAEAKTDIELGIAARLLEYLVDDGGFGDAVREGAKTWPTDAPVRARYPAAAS